MAQVVRRIVRNGDTTTAGGMVIAPGANYTVMGRQIANVNCKVDCPACGSTGTIKSAPPTPPVFDYGGMHAAFDGDLCICGCTPHPRLLSSLDNWTVSNFGAPISSTPAAADWLVFAGHDPEDHGIRANQSFLIADEATGEPLAGVPYQLECDGQWMDGVTDANGLTQKIHSLAEGAAVSVYLGTSV